MISVAHSQNLYIANAAFILLAPRSIASGHSDKRPLTSFMTSRTPCPLDKLIFLGESIFRSETNLCKDSATVTSNALV